MNWGQLCVRMKANKSAMYKIHQIVRVEDLRVFIDYSSGGVSAYSRGRYPVVRVHRSLIDRLQYIIRMTKGREVYVPDRTR